MVGSMTCTTARGHVVIRSRTCSVRVHERTSDRGRVRITMGKTVKVAKISTFLYVQLLFTFSLIIMAIHEFPSLIF